MKSFWLLVVAAVLLLVAPVRVGDLAGYDEAVYAHIAKAIVKSGNWVDIQSNGFPALEHPPGFVWMQAALFSLFGFSDALAKLPSALCGVGVVVLVFWLARRLLGERAALIAMLVMLATPYFIKYTSHAMTDVPFTFLFLAAVCAWIKSEEHPAWYPAVWIFVSYALLTRGIVGFAVVGTLGIDAILRRRGALAYVTLVLSAVPLAAWYAHLAQLHGDFFWQVQTSFLRDKTGVPNPLAYAWMLAKSYWPWLPFLAIGLWVRDPKLRLITIWAAMMYAAASFSGAAVLRYLLPAYPAFSILAAVGLMRVIPERHLDAGLRWLAPIALLASIGIAIFPPVNLHAEEIKPIATAAKSVTREDERLGFYDAGQPRFDETGQIQWYGDRTMWIVTNETDFAKVPARVWIVDGPAYDQRFATRSDVIARSGHLVLLRLTEPAQP
jgi:4-amino-4-deoxy-L-arabinose transferase-like glycosyltransferase